MMKKSISFVLISCLFISMQQAMQEIVPKAPLELEEIEEQGWPVALAILATLGAGAAWRVIKKFRKIKNEKKWRFVVEKGDHEEIQRLIDAGIDVNIRDDRGSTALIEAAKWGYDSRMLLNAKAEVNIRDGSGSTALIEATLGGHTAMVRDLLKVPGIDVNIRSDTGSTALILAANYRNLDIVRMLLQAGADWTIKNLDGKMVYDLADERIRNIIQKKVN